MKPVGDVTASKTSVSKTGVSETGGSGIGGSVIGGSGTVAVEMVYAEAQRAVVKPLSLPSGATLAEALRMTSEDADFRSINLGSAPIGIFGELAQRDRILCDGDRIEIYRPLAEDPKTARRKRAGLARPNSALRNRALRGKS